MLHAPIMKIPKTGSHLFCMQVEAEAVVIEADDVAEALSAEVNKYAVSKLVIGVSSRNIFTR